MVVNQPAKSIDADDYTVIPTAGSFRPRRLKEHSTVRREELAIAVVDRRYPDGLRFSSLNLREATTLAHWTVQ